LGGGEAYKLNVNNYLILLKGAEVHRTLFDSINVRTSDVSETLAPLNTGPWTSTVMSSFNRDILLMSCICRMLQERPLKTC